MSIRDALEHSKGPKASHRLCGRLSAPRALLGSPLCAPDGAVMMGSPGPKGTTSPLLGLLWRSSARPHRLLDCPRYPLEECRGALIFLFTSLNIHVFTTSTPHNRAVTASGSAPSPGSCQAPSGAPQLVPNGLFGRLQGAQEGSWNGLKSILGRSSLLSVAFWMVLLSWGSSFVVLDWALDLPGVHMNDL